MIAGRTRVAAPGAAAVAAVAVLSLVAGSAGLSGPPAAMIERTTAAVVESVTVDTAPVALIQSAGVAPQPGDVATVAAVTPKAAGPRVEMPMTHVWQSLNNCGPAAVVMALSTMGISASQETARLALRGTDERRGMGPGPVDPWVSAQFGIRSFARNNGTNDLMKRLLANGFAPMVTQWMIDPPDRTAHWRTVRGYDDARGVFFVNDSMRGNNVALDYGWFERNWQPFSYRYMVLYRPEDAPLLQAIVSDDWSDLRARERLYERAKAEAAAHGTSAAFLAYGEAAYQFCKFEEAVAAFEKGLSLGLPTGVFTLRSSYPNSLRMIGREDAAREAQARYTNITSVPASSSTTPQADGVAVLLAQRRANGINRTPSPY